MNRPERPPVVVTGMALNTALGDTVDGVFEALMAGRSGIGPWRAFEPPPAGSPVGGDLTGYDIAAKLASLRERLPGPVALRLDRLLRRNPWPAKLTLLVAADAALQAGFWSSPARSEDVAVICAGHNIGARYGWENWLKFQAEPDYIEPLSALHYPDTNHAAVVSELLGTKGSIGTIGAACASGNYALRAALDELAEGAAAVVVVAPIYEYAPTTFQSLGMMGATTASASAGRASRPFDADRDGFVPSHGAAAVILERREVAEARGAAPLAEIVGAEGSTDACHRPPRPIPEQQAALIRDLLDAAGIGPSDVDLVSAHAASTPAGDLAEGRAVSRALGPHVPVNATKSMLGHTGWSSALVELIVAIEEVRRGAVHGTANLDLPDPELALAFAAPGARDVRTVVNNAFGFGGLNCVSLLRRVG